MVDKEIVNICLKAKILISLLLFIFSKVLFVFHIFY